MNYLRNVEDPYGPRMISLGPSYNTNQHIVASSMADIDRWPELAMPSSPPVSDTEGDDEKGDGQPNFGATGLKHTQTIMGGRTGGLGLRVDGKRYSSSKRLSGGSTPRNPSRRMLRVKEDLEPVKDALPPPPTTTRVIGASSDEGEVNVKIQGPTVVEEAPVQVQKTVQFIPKFKNAAEMEARRRVRMMARRGVNQNNAGSSSTSPSPQPAPPPPPPPQILTLDTSEEEESSSSEELSDDGQGSMDDGDEFDPYAFPIPCSFKVLIPSYHPVNSLQHVPQEKPQQASTTSSPQSQGPKPLEPDLVKAPPHLNTPKVQ